MDELQRYVYIYFVHKGEILPETMGEWLFILTPTLFDVKVISTIHGPINRLLDSPKREVGEDE